MTSDVSGPDGVERARLLRLYVASGDQLTETMTAPLQRRLRDEYGPIYRLDVPFGADVYVVTDPAGVRDVVERNAEDFRRSRRRLSDLRTLFGDGVVTAEGARWRRRRSALASAFTSRRTETLAETAVRVTRAKLGWWSETKDSVETTSLSFDLTLELLGSLLFGAIPDDSREAIQEALVCFQRSFPREASLLPTGPRWLPTPHNRRVTRARTLLDGAMADAVRACRTTDADGLIGDLLSRESLDEAAVRNEARTLLVAGLVTSKALSVALSLLAGHPAVRRRARECVRRGGAPGESAESRSERRTTSRDGYLRDVVREVLRLHPPLPPDVRSPVAETTVCGHALPAGSKVVLNQVPIHHDPQFWNRPLAFDPDRFADGWRSDRPRFSYYPFGGGPRACLGREVALTAMEGVLGALLDGYDLAPVGSDADVGDNPTDPRAVEVTLEPLEGD